MNYNKQWPVEVTKDLNYEQKMKAEIFNMLSPSKFPAIHFNSVGKQTILLGTLIGNHSIENKHNQPLKKRIIPKNENNEARHVLKIGT